MKTESYKDGGDLHARWANLIGKWCIEHQEKYGEPPNSKLKGIFQDWASTTKAPDETIRTIEKFLGHLSKQHDQDKERSSDYLLDVAGRYLNKVRIKETIEATQEDLQRGKVVEAHDRLTQSSRIELGQGSMVKLSEDYSAWAKAFERDQERPLIEYPGDLGKLVGDIMRRDTLLCLMAVDKAGKSFWLLDLAYRAVLNRKRVAYFEAGDLGEEETILRMGSRATRLPLKDCTAKIPTHEWDDEKKPMHDERFLKKLSSQKAFKTFRKVCRKRDRFRLSCHPNSSLSVSGISSILRDWEREDWFADVCVIDYADILAPPTGIRETLDQIDSTWKGLRRLSQEMHCLVITASQTNAAAYKNNPNGLLSRQHFSGRKTKLAHVNGMLGLNVSDADKENGVTRVNWIVRRRGSFSERQFVRVAGCLDIACPVIRSTF